jgi:hypothetical protein
MNPVMSDFVRLRRHSLRAEAKPRQLRPPLPEMTFQEVPIALPDLMTAKELEALLRMDAKYEAGRSVPTLDMLLKLRASSGRSPDWILTGE